MDRDGVYASTTPNKTKVTINNLLRDEVILTNAPGKASVDFYYKVSPPVAELISKSGLLKFIVRMLLTPFVGFASIFIHQEMMWLFAALIFAWVFMRKKDSIINRRSVLW